MPAALVTKEILPKIRLVPLLMAIATPSPPSTISGSIQDGVVIKRTIRTNSTAKAEIIITSLTVLVVATAVETALPVIALSSPISARISSTA